MRDVVNLNKARKAKAAALARSQAAENRVKFGRTGAQKKQAERERAAAQSALDGAKRDPT
jgi:hypothetical protein